MLFRLLTSRCWIAALVVNTVYFWGIAAGFAQNAAVQRILIAPQLQVFPLENEASTEELRQSLHRGFASYIRSASESFTLVETSALETRLTERPLFEGTAALANQWGQMGFESYKRLHMGEAIAQFERALENYDTLRYGMLAPSDLAEILLYLSLSYLEEGNNVVRPLELMKEMIALDPSKVLRAGYYPEYIVHFYENARHVLLQELLEVGPKPAMALELAELVDADYVLYAFVLATRSGPPRLLTYLYSVSNNEFLDPEVQLLGSLSPADLSEAASRVMSRYTACLFEPEREAPTVVAASRGEGPLSIQIQGAYASFLRYPSPIESTFGNYGISVGATFLLTREFGLTGRLQILNSIRDYNGILRDDFTTLRALVGSQLVWSFGPLSFAMDTSLELTSVGPIRAFGDKNCIPAPDILCPDGRNTVVLDQNGVLLGVNLRPQLAYRVARSFQFVASTSMSYFFYPLTDRILNFPLSTELGVQYRF